MRWQWEQACGVLRCEDLLKRLLGRLLGGTTGKKQESACLEGAVGVGVRIVWGMGLEALIGLESPLHDLGIPLQIRVSI